jgi:ParB-like chromosome segregation protein Spo0J
MQYKTIPVEKIEPWHEVTDYDRLEWILEDMKENGWCGRPLVVIEIDGEYQALTGSHRYEAAKEVGLSEIPCAVVAESVLDHYSLSEIMRDEINTRYIIGEFDEKAGKLLQVDLDEHNR